MTTETSRPEHRRVVHFPITPGAVPLRATRIPLATDEQFSGSPVEAPARPRDVMQALRERPVLRLMSQALQ